MANEFNCGCNAGRTYLIDPNLSAGNGFEKTFVPPEDLNIYVELTTTSKSRSIISVDTTGEATTDNSLRSKTKISFIDGTDLGQKDSEGEPIKSLTTKYTELTTVFNRNEDTENLGITSIDINFNSSYAPLIKINFTDVRGSSVFQHGNDSPYSVFFELPYPIFELTVKGYYGKPVKYCLHLTRWNSKFNSETGNFEIVAEFIGYTYAMLTDMLLGYIRAITETPMGINKFNELKEEVSINGTQEDVDSFITITQLLDAIELLNVQLSKLKEDDVDLLQLANNTNVSNSIKTIDDLIDEKIGVIRVTLENAVLNTGDGLFAIKTPNNNESTNDTFSTYQSMVKTKADEINTELKGDFKFKIDELTTNVKQVPNIKLDDIKNGNTASVKPLREGLDDQQWEEYKTELVNGLSTTVKGDERINIYNFRSAKKEVKRLRDKLAKNDTLLTQVVGQKAAKIAVDTLGFQPTIRNIFNIFTTHVEIFLECLRDVSIKAYDDETGDRAIELAKLGNKGDTFDVHRDAEKIYPWPLYRKERNDGEGNYEEAWMGAEPNIISEKIPELLFVENLLEGLLKVNTNENERLEALYNQGEFTDAWFPVNPIDTPLFGVTECPWTNPAISESKDNNFILNFMSMRAMAFFTNFSDIGKINDDEVRAMAAGDAAAAHAFIKNKDIKDNISNLGGNNLDNQVDNILDILLNPINDKKTTPTPSIREDGDKYYYNWIDDTVIAGSNSNNGGIIPFTGNFSREPFFNGDNKYMTSNFGDEEDIIYLRTDNPSNAKDGVWLKIFTEEEYNKTDFNIPTFNETDTYSYDKLFNAISTYDEYTYVSLDGLYEIALDSKKRIKGWNILQGKYNIQEIETIQIGEELSAPEQKSTHDPDGRSILSQAVFFRNAYDKCYVGNTYLKLKAKVTTSLAKGKTKSFYDEDVTFKLNNGEISLFNLNVENDDLPEGKIYAGSLDENGKIRDYYDYGKTSIDGNLAPSHGKNRELYLDALEGNQDVWVPNVGFASEMDGNNGVGVNIFSLFGSKLYFEQRRSYNMSAARAYLFLHTLPWYGLIDEFSDGVFYDDTYGIFNNPNQKVIDNLFSNRAAFIHAPKSWAAFIGAILWRLDDSDIINEEGSEHLGGSGKWDPITWGIPLPAYVNTPISEFKDTHGLDKDYYFKTFDPHPNKYKKLRYKPKWFPQRDQYCSPAEGCASFQIGADGSGKYKNISYKLKRLPEGVKREFKMKFFEFVNGEDWKSIRDELEIFKKDWEKLNDGSSAETLSTNKKHPSQFVNGTITYENGFASINNDAFDISNFRTKALKNYQAISKARWYSDGYSINTNPTRPTTRDSYDECNENYNLELKRGVDVQNLLRGIFTDVVIIGNCNPKMWNDDFDNTNEVTYNETTIITKQLFKTYVRAWLQVFKEFNKTDSKIDVLAEEQAKQEIFNTMDDDTIRLNIYRHCKAIYDKWLGGSGKDIMFTCGERQEKDTKHAKKGGRTTPSLIDSFRFVNRAFNDIGDDFLLNPSAITSILTKNYNQSFYNLISRILADNNFNFIPLPTYVDYEKPSDMCELFEANIFNDRVKDTISGPAFVCVYAGQTSNKLDMGKNSDYPDDGFDLYCDDNNNLIGAPPDFTTQKKDFEYNVPAFMVNYGHQNQNIFKSVNLDQREFSETDESLVITDAIAKGGSSTNRTFAGQNLWNIYQMRSYSAGVESMGNAQIQPMMYFQLNNIPMFHGAYMIINVEHKIQPNHMSTNFTGVRIRYTDTPLIKAESLYMSLLGTLSDVDGSGTLVGSQIQGNNQLGNLNYSLIDNSNGIFIQNSSSKTYVWDTSNGFAGTTLREFIDDLEKYLQEQHPTKKIKLESNGITRDIESTTKGGKSRSSTSKHGAGLAIDVIFSGIYDGKELGNPYDDTSTGCKRTNVTCYGWYDGNKIVVKDTDVMKSIREFVDTNTKWKDVIKWGADFKYNGAAGRIKISGFPTNGEARIDEIHHFEIKDGVMAKYIPNEAKIKLEKLGITIPNKQSDLAELYSYPYQNNIDAKRNIQEDESIGDEVDDDNIS